MLPIPHGRRRRRFWTLCASFFCAAGCIGGDSASSQSQRRIGEARLQDDFSVSLTYGSVRAFNSEQLVVRSASPLVEMTFEGGPEATGPVAVELRNQHLGAQLRTVSATFLDADDLEGCPVVTGLTLDCVAASERIGEACETSGQCSAGLRCAENICAPTNRFDACIAPDFTRIPDQETSIRFEIPADPCRRVVLETVLPDEFESQPLRFGVVGPSNDDAVITALGPEFRARELDFVVLLGNNVAQSNEEGLRALELALTRLGTPAVMVAGPREVSSESGAAFLRRFGPHDHVWELKGTRFLAFYSAGGELGPRGLTRIDEFLSQLERDASDDSPLLAVTHTPPFDPNGLRDNGLRSEFEAAQLLSLMESRGVDQVYAGGLGTGYGRIHDVETYVTTAVGTVANPLRQWLEVTVADDGEREIGGRGITVETLEIE